MGFLDNKANPRDRFDLTLGYGDNGISDINIIRDKKTGVNYMLISEVNHGATICPLYDADGKILVTSEDEE